MGIFTIPFSFLDLEDLNAEYERSVRQAIRAASLFQACAGTANLGPYFLSTRLDPFAQYIQRVQFEREAESAEAGVKDLVLKLAIDCRRRSTIDPVLNSDNAPNGERRARGNAEGKQA